MDWSSARHAVYIEFAVADDRSKVIAVATTGSRRRNDDRGSRRRNDEKDPDPATSPARQRANRLLATKPSNSVSKIDRNA